MFFEVNAREHLFKKERKEKGKENWISQTIPIHFSNVIQMNGRFKKEEKDLFFFLIEYMNITEEHKILEGDKSFVDDLIKEQGTVRVRVASVPRSTEVPPLFYDL